MLNMSAAVNNGSRIFVLGQNLYFMGSSVKFGYRSDKFIELTLNINDTNK